MKPLSNYILHVATQAWPFKSRMLSVLFACFLLKVNIWPSVLWNISDTCSAKKQALKESVLPFLYLSCTYIYIYQANTCVFALFAENVNDHADENELFFFLKKTWGCTLSSLATVQISMMAVGSSSPRLLALLQYSHKCPTVAPVNTSLGFFLPLRAVNELLLLCRLRTSSMKTSLSWVSTFLGLFLNIHISPPTTC